MASGSWSRCHRHSSRPALTALAVGCPSTCGLDGIGGRTEFVRGDVCDDPGPASSGRGMPCRPSKVSGRAHGMAARRASLHHRDLTAHPGAGLPDRLAWSRVIRLSRLEKGKHVLCTRRRPKSQEMVNRISEGPTATNRHQARVPDIRKDHRLGAPAVRVRPTPGRQGDRPLLNRSVVPASGRALGVVRPG